MRVTISEHLDILFVVVLYFRSIQFYKVVFQCTYYLLMCGKKVNKQYVVFSSNKMSFLMDCGEGTYKQMCYHYGRNVDIILKQLRTIFVSHMHIDHHLVNIQFLVCIMVLNYKKLKFTFSE